MNKKFSDLIAQICFELDRRDVSKEVRESMDLALNDMIQRKGHAPIKEAKQLLASVLESQLIQEGYTEDCFALVPDPQNPDTWGYRIRTKAGEVWDKGIRVAIESLSDIVQQKGRGAVPMLLRIQEAEKVYKFNRVWVQERAVLVKEAEGKKGKLSIIILEPGLNKDGDKFYSKELLAQSVEMFEGVKMFENHATEQEDFERPEGDLGKWVAVLENVHIGDRGELRGTASIIDPDFLEKVELLEKQDVLEQLGVSINAFGEFKRDTMGDVEISIVTKFTEIRSADFVTRPGAGGKALMLESSRFDVGQISLEQFRTKRPDLVKELEAPLMELKEKERKQMDWEKKCAELEAQIKENTETWTKEKTTLDTQLQEAGAKIKEFEERSKLAALALDIGKKITESELPKAVQDKLTAQLMKKGEAVVGVTLESVDTTITLEKDTLIKLTESGVTGLGRGSEDEDEDMSKDAKTRKDGEAKLKESHMKRFTRQGLSEEDAEKRTVKLMAVN